VYFKCFILVDKGFPPAGMVGEASFVITAPLYSISPYVAWVPPVHSRQEGKYNYPQALWNKLLSITCQILVCTFWCEDDHRILQAPVC